MTTQSVGYKAKAFEARNLAFFFLIALVYPLLLYLLDILGIVISPFRSSTFTPAFLLYLPVILGPTFAAFVVTGFTEGKPGVRALWRRFWNRNASIKWLIVALLLLPVLRLVAGVLTQVLNDPSYPLFPEDAISSVITGILWGLFAGLKEEFGWRGYVLPRFQAKWNALTSSIVLGVITGL